MPWDLGSSRRSWIDGAMAEACWENVAGPYSASSQNGDWMNKVGNFTTHDKFVQNTIDDTAQTGPVFCGSTIRDSQTVILFLNKCLCGYLSQRYGIYKRIMEGYYGLTRQTVRRTASLWYSKQVLLTSCKTPTTSPILIPPLAFDSNCSWSRSGTRRRISSACRAPTSPHEYM